MLERLQGFHYVDQINKVVDRGLEPPTSSEVKKHHFLLSCVRKAYTQILNKSRIEHHSCLNRR